MRLQPVIHANRRLEEVPYGDHAVSLEEHVRSCAALRSSSPPVCMAECVEFKGWVSRCDPKGHKERRRRLECKGANSQQKPQIPSSVLAAQAGSGSGKAAPPQARR